ncbi:WD40-like Beta Propeller Repeat [Bradyrhizobium lablabi]|uniref:WD40-like Beta Propeller Repeat n=1 Tax=Bradyrhizobium lablabi TaxID=722472 RepID=A0A1M6Y010_9BRAD|nr:PD40 domain-containing protein [Bradyrhizobium lablabi]SHL11612.1 WD40-like Beta Propeller Repeat [Bradyrhizobium lablabi]
MRTIDPIILMASLIASGLCPTAASSQISPTLKLITDYGCVRDWSARTNKLLMDERDENGVYQVYTLNPDGSDLRAITGGAGGGGPAANRHKGFAHFDPKGRYIVMEAELAEQLVGNSARVQKAVSPGSGVWMDLWVVTTDGRHWTNLTNFTTGKLTGALSPHFSPDGRRIVYARLIGKADSKRTFGYFELHMADFSEEGSPHLANDRVLLGGDGVYEPHGFSRDGTKVLFASDHGLPNTMGLDLFEYDLGTNQVRNLTNSPDQYDEHARYSPDGSRIAWGSSQGIASYRTNLKTLASEAYLMNADGGGKSERLTHFNEKGFPESTMLQSGVWPTAFSPDGTQLVVAQQPIGDLLSGKESANKSWLVSLGPPKASGRDR